MNLHRESLVKYSRLAWAPLLSAAFVGAWACTAHAAPVAHWGVEGEPIGDGYGSDGGITATAGTSTPHAATLTPLSAGGAVVAEVVEITSTGAKPAGYTKAIDVTSSTSGFAFPTFNGAYSGADTANATFDLYVSPDSLALDDQVLFETGGNGAGSAIGLLNNNLVLAVGGSTTTVDLAAVYADQTPDFQDYLYIRAVIDVVNNKLTLHVGNLGTGLVASSSNESFTVNDWAGTEGGGLLNSSGTVASGLQSLLTGGSPSAIAFDGQFADLIYYNEALGEIVVPEPGSVSLIGLGCIFMFWRRRMD